MDLNTLKAEHPELYKLAVDEGKELGRAEERDRVLAHLELGEQCGAMDTATAAIKVGDGMTQTLIAKYTASGINKGDLDNRSEDNVDDVETPSGSSEGNDNAVRSIFEKAGEIAGTKIEFSH